MLVLIYTILAIWVAAKYGAWVAALNLLAFIWGLFVWHAKTYQDAATRKVWTKEFTDALKAFSGGGQKEKSETDQKYKM
jgi:hypothetical protein